MLLPPRLEPNHRPFFIIVLYLVYRIRRVSMVDISTLGIGAGVKKVGVGNSFPKTYYRSVLAPSWLLSKLSLEKPPQGGGDVLVHRREPYTTVYIYHTSTPPWGGFRSSIAPQPRGYHYRTIRLRKALGEMFPTPTFLAPAPFQLSRYRPWKIGLLGGVIV